MKTFIRFITLILACGLLAGCMAHKTTDAASDNHRKPAPGISLHNYNEYLEFIENTELPQDFLYYESIRHFGTFEFLYCELGCSDRLYYDYRMTDDAGFTASYIINDTNDIDLSNTTILSDTEVNLSDMRRIENDDGPCTYIAYGIHYRYSFGCLMSIQWYRNGVYCVLQCSPQYISDHPLDSTAIGQLLNIEGKSESELLSLIGMSY